MACRWRRRRRIGANLGLALLIALAASEVATPDHGGSCELMTNICSSKPGPLQTAWQIGHARISDDTRSFAAAVDEERAKLGLNCIRHCCDDALVVDAQSLWLWQTFQNRSSPSTDDLLNQIVSEAPVLQSTGITGLPVQSDTLVAIEVNLHIERVWGFDMKQQSFKAKMRWELTWKDCRVLHSPLDHHQLVIVSSDNAAFRKIWRPHVRISEAQEVGNNEYDEFLVLHDGGLVTLVHRESQDIACSFNFERMPFDEQACKITLSEQRLPTSLMVLHWGRGLYTDAKSSEVSVHSSGAFASNKLSNSEWEFEDVSKWRLGVELEATDYGQLSGLSTEFTVRRRSRNMIMSYCFPAALYTIISYAGLFLNRDAVPARTAAHLLPLIMLANTRNALSAALPPISYATRLNDFILGSLVLCFFMMVQYVSLHALGLLQKWSKAHKKAKESAVAPVGMESAEESDDGRPRESPKRWCEKLMYSALANEHLIQIADVWSRVLFLLVFLGMLIAFFV